MWRACAALRLFCRSRAFRSFVAPRHQPPRSAHHKRRRRPPHRGAPSDALDPLDPSVVRRHRGLHGRRSARRTHQLRPVFDDRRPRTNGRFDRGDRVDGLDAAVRVGGTVAVVNESDRCRGARAAGEDPAGPSGPRSVCGTGTILRAVRRREPSALVVGTDRDPKALDLAARNLSGPLSQAAAESLPFATGSVDRVVANLPFGKQVGSHRGNRTLYPSALDELDRVLTADGRAVLLTEDKRLLHTAIERQGGLKVVRQRLLKYNGATPTAYVLSRTRPARTTASSNGDR
ncbi:methyltransferase domain-containing protein [Kribbella speibonae]|uniref:Methyltransferase domain-containing protein n=1 Tax=Kribbella speibonae TaxID=1572660 RepID=A0A4R0IEK0_9ACTN|nr:methyltransferase domain-containing protein [Kribbella speibonae]TCC29626.1 methyltransferase domain-containing protein [Kribbella speibonae]